MNNLKYLFIFLLIFTSCSDDEEILPSVSSTYSNLHAPQSGGMGQPITGDFTKFDFSTGMTTTDANDWDIAFRGTTIIVNGGASTGTNDEPTRTGAAAAGIASGTFASVISADIAMTQDSATGPAIQSGSGNGWYNYSGPPTFIITPIPGKILVFKTRDDRYAKVEILSYYKDAPAVPNARVHESRYYTFNYLYNPNKGNTDLQ